MRVAGRVIGAITAVFATAPSFPLAAPLP